MGLDAPCRPQFIALYSRPLERSPASPANFWSVTGRIRWRLRLAAVAYAKKYRIQVFIVNFDFWNRPFYCEQKNVLNSEYLILNSEHPARFLAMKCPDMRVSSRHDQEIKQIGFGT